MSRLSVTLMVAVPAVSEAKALMPKSTAKVFAVGAGLARMV